MYFYKLCIKYRLRTALIVQLLVFLLCIRFIYFYEGKLEKILFQIGLDQPRNLSLFHRSGVFLPLPIIFTISAMFERFGFGCMNYSLVVVIFLLSLFNSFVKDSFCIFDFCGSSLKTLSVS